MQFKFENLFNRLVRMIPSSSGKILYNKWVLYFIFVVGIYDIIHFYQRGNTMAVAIFFIVGFLTSFFSKNMIVVIVSAIAVSHIVAYGNKMSEGFEEGEEEEEEEEGFGIEEDEKEDEKEDSTEKEDSEKKDSTMKNSTMKDSTMKNSTMKNSSMKNSKKEDSDNFESNIEKMQTLLEQTEKLLSETTQQGFTGMKSAYAEYR